MRCRCSRGIDLRLLRNVHVDSHADLKLSVFGWFWSLRAFGFRLLVQIQGLITQTP